MGRSRGQYSSLPPHRCHEFVPKSFELDPVPIDKLINFCRPDDNTKMEITREVFDQQRHPRFGNGNPERMQLEFWEWMIRGHEDLPKGKVGPAKWGWIMREEILKSAYGPYLARDLFKIPLNREEGPIWTFERMGRSHTKLRDG